MKHILRAEHLVKTYGDRTVVDQVSLDIESGEIVGLLGPNGAGKSTTFYMICGMIAPDAGRIRLDDYDVTQEPMYLRARKGLGYLPQEPSIFRGLTARQNIRAVCELYLQDESDIEERTDALIREFGLEQVAHTRGSLLSGGERRRVEIARALAAEPAFILLDEPFAGIDPITIQELQGIIQALKQRNIGIIITDHNIRETLRITDRAYILSSGTILKHGTPEEIASDPKIHEVYLGKDFTLN